MDGSFRTTIWSSIRSAKEGRSTALDDFARKYRGPVVAYLKQKGRSAEDADDVAQDVFLLIFRDGLLARADASRGRFRAFLLAVVKNVMRNEGRGRSAEKRGGGRAGVSLDAPAGDDATLGSLLEAREEDEAFDREWAHHLVGLALDSLARLHPQSHQALRLQMDEGLDYDAIGRKLGLDHRQVEYLLEQAKAKMAASLRSEIAAYCSSPGEFEEETAFMNRYLRRK